jgi:hypothetical protein
MPELKLLSVNETWWNSDCIACEQTSGYGPANKGTIRIDITLDRTLTIQKFDHGMRQVGSVVFKDLDVDGMLQYLQDVKQFLDEQALVNKLMGRK